MAEPIASEQPKGIRQTGGLVFSGILLALILKDTLDVFFKDASSFDTVLMAAHQAGIRPVKSFVLFTQLIVFLFTVIRFYWGTHRYHEEIPDSESTSQFLIGMIGALFVFGGFYVTGLLIKTTNLFYASLGFVHVLDFGWFLIAGAILQDMKPAMRRMGNVYMLLDMITVLVLTVFIILDSVHGATQYLLYQWIMLASLLFLGVLDLCYLWPFYVNRSDWEEKFQKAR